MRRKLFIMEVVIIVFSVVVVLPILGVQINIEKIYGTMHKITDINKLPFHGLIWKFINIWDFNYLFISQMTAVIFIFMTLVYLYFIFKKRYFYLATLVYCISLFLVGYPYKWFLASCLITLNIVYLKMN